MNCFLNRYYFHTLQELFSIMMSNLRIIDLDITICRGEPLLPYDDFSPLIHASNYDLELAAFKHAGIRTHVGFGVFCCSLSLCLS